MFYKYLCSNVYLREKNWCGLIDSTCSESVKFEQLWDHVISNPKHAFQQYESSIPITFQILESLQSHPEMICMLRGYKVIIWEPIFIADKSRQFILAVRMKLFKPRDGVDRNILKVGWKICQICGTAERNNNEANELLVSFSVAEFPSEDNRLTTLRPEIKWKGSAVVQGWKLTDEPNFNIDRWMETSLSSLLTDPYMAVAMRLPRNHSFYF
ncbi:hypothetical protein Fcan01_27398 [Folsomia candida]|uniref:Uncharacterized protein n=1 Tax=Folsomia candida TaxID=158441 RepID=A0A226CZB9_FOLCA|nr:hypothetical protein Fcan01_27398 [Folsomia candida]